MASTTALILGGLTAAGAIGGAAISSNASQSAASTESNEAQNALNFQEQVYQNEIGYQQPYMQAGTASLSQLMQGISNGTYGTPTGPAPTFTAPTLAQAQQTPGYEFTAQQGSKGILEGAAAAGGEISGGTLKALDQYNTNLANTTYNTVYNQALSNYGANLSTWQAQQSAQQQAYSQLLSPVALGQGAATSLTGASNQAASTVASLMSSIGASQAAGTIGSANAINAGISGASSSITQGMLLNSLLGTGSSMNTPNPLFSLTGDPLPNYAP